MNEPTLTDTEREALQEARGLRVPTGGMSSVLDRCEREVERIVAEAVDRERAAWATKVEVLLLDWRGLPVWGPNTQGLMILDDVDSESLMADLRALLAADDTEAQA